MTQKHCSRMAAREILRKYDNDVVEAIANFDDYDAKNFLIQTHPIIPTIDVDAFTKQYLNEKKGKFKLKLGNANMQFVVHNDYSIDFDTSNVIKGFQNIENNPNIDKSKPVFLL